jgi:hypothetical protein
VAAVAAAGVARAGVDPVVVAVAVPVEAVAVAAAAGVARVAAGADFYRSATESTAG